MWDTHKANIPKDPFRKMNKLVPAVELLVFRGVNHSSHEQDTVGAFMIYKEEKRPVDYEGVG